MDITPICQVPKPTVCGWCHGCGIEPDEECGEIPCMVCNGFGIGICEFMLPPSRTKNVRAVRYEPGYQRLTITQDKTTKRYIVRQLPTTKGWEHGLAFAVENESDREVYDIFTGQPDVSCTCPGFTFEQSKKADRRALRRGEIEEMTGWGCAHTDAVLSLASEGWFDINCIK